MSSGIGGGAIVGTLVAALAASGGAGAAERDGWEVRREPARAFKVKDLAGAELRSTDLAGKVVVVDFWATWCAPCLKELPDLAAYQERLKGRKDVALLSFNVTDERDTLAAFVKEHKIAFPVYQGDSLIGPYELSAFPTKLIIDMRAAARDGGKGVVRFRREGYTPVASIEERVAELLAGAP
jgi:thiol-disulfide isomerase/thioredoxin